MESAGAKSRRRDEKVIFVLGGKLPNDHWEMGLQNLRITCRNLLFLDFVAPDIH